MKMWRRRLGGAGTGYQRVDIPHTQKIYKAENWKQSLQSL
jgi:hypothetical protein